MYKVLIVLIIGLAGAYVLTVKNISLNISNSFLPAFFQKETIIIQKEEPVPASPKIYATNGGPFNRKGTLKVTSRKTISIIFIEDETKKKLGPYDVPANKAIHLELKKGNYHAEIFTGSEKEVTSLKFLGDTGNLDL